MVKDGFTDETILGDRLLTKIRTKICVFAGQSRIDGPTECDVSNGKGYFPFGTSFLTDITAFSVILCLMSTENDTLSAQLRHFPSQSVIFSR